MTLTWQFEERPSYVCMITGGTTTHHGGDASNLFAYVQDLHRHAQETGYTRYLLDRRQVEYSPTTLEADLAIHDSGRMIEELRVGALIHRVAILVTPQRLPDTSFQEDVYNNRGITLRFFADEQESVTWLTAT